MLYLSVKVVHLVSLIVWFAGIFYIWRLFVYHAESNSFEVKSQLETMERRLYGIIMWPAAILTLASGFTMFFLKLDLLKKQKWLHIKITLVLILFIHHHLAGYYRRKLAKGINYPPKLFRIMNEIPVLFLITIIILVVFRPF